MAELCTGYLFFNDRRLERVRRRKWIKIISVQFIFSRCHRSEDDTDAQNMFH